MYMAAINKARLQVQQFRHPTSGADATLLHPVLEIRRPAPKPRLLPHHVRRAVPAHLVPLDSSVTTNHLLNHYQRVVIERLGISPILLKLQRSKKSLDQVMGIDTDESANSDDEGSSKEDDIATGVGSGSEHGRGDILATGRSPSSDHGVDDASQDSQPPPPHSQSQSQSQLSRDDGGQDQPLSPQARIERQRAKSIQRAASPRGLAVKEKRMSEAAAYAIRTEQGPPRHIDLTLQSQAARNAADRDKGKVELTTVITREMLNEAENMTHTEWEKMTL